MIDTRNIIYSNSKAFPKQHKKQKDAGLSKENMARAGISYTNPETKAYQINIQSAYQAKTIDDLINLILEKGETRAEIFNQIASKDIQLATDIIRKIESIEPFAEDPGFVGYILLVSIQDKQIRERIIIKIQKCAPEYKKKIFGEISSDAESDFIIESKNELNFHQYEKLSKKVDEIKEHLLAASRAFKLAKLAEIDAIANGIIGRIGKLSPSIDKFRFNMIKHAKEYIRGFHGKYGPPAKYSKYSVVNPFTKRKDAKLYIKAFFGLILSMDPKEKIYKERAKSTQYYLKQMGRMGGRNDATRVNLGLGWNLYVRLKEVNKLFDAKRVKKIKKYAKEYSVDPKLIAAVSLREQRAQTIHENISDILGSLIMNTTVGLGQVSIKTAKKEKLLDKIDKLPDWDIIVALRLLNDDNNIKAAAKYIHSITKKLTKKYGRQPNCHEIAAYYALLEKVAPYMIYYQPMFDECYSDIEDSGLFD